MINRFPLGEFPPDNVDAAAELLLRYEDAHLVGREFYGMLAMSVADVTAVLKRAKEIRAARTASVVLSGSSTG